MKKLFVFLIVFLTISIQVKSQHDSKGQTIVAAEYFYNLDPGEGNGVPVTAQFGTSIVNMSFNTIAEKGTVIYLRLKSSNGKWSSPSSIKYNGLTNRGSNLTEGEYFINTDPGIGNGTPITIISEEIFIPSVSINRNDIFYLRLKDSFERWSPVHGVKYRFKDLVFAEYRIKFANGTFTQFQPMSIIDHPVNSPFYIALSDPISPISKNDSIIVHFQDSDYFNSTSITVGGIFRENDIPTKFELYNTYPNPFNPSTIIRYDIPTATQVILSIHDILGRLVCTLVDEYKTPGTYNVRFSANGITTGIYFCLIRAGSYKMIRKMSLIK